MKRLSLLTLIFAALSLTFFLLLIFLRIPSPLYPLMSIQDTIDILTSLILIPVYWLMFKSVTNNKSSLSSEIAFMVLSAFWAAGQGMHLSANSIDNLIGNLVKNQVSDVTPTAIFHLTYFYDEYLGHYLWHIGAFGLAALLIFEGWHQAADEKTDWRMVTPAGMLYGFTYFCFVDEGNTLSIGLPFSVVTTLLFLGWGRQKLAQQPVLAFFFVALLVATLLFAIWGLYWGCYPPILEPSHC